MCIYVYVFKFIYMHGYIITHMHVCLHIYSHIYLYTHTCAQRERTMLTTSKSGKGEREIFEVSNVYIRKEERLRINESIMHFKEVLKRKTKQEKHKEVNKEQK